MKKYCKLYNWLSRTVLNINETTMRSYMTVSYAYNRLWWKQSIGSSHTELYRLWYLKSKSLRSTSIRNKSDTFTSDRCQFDVSHKLSILITAHFVSSTKHRCLTQTNKLISTLEALAAKDAISVSASEVFFLIDYKCVRRWYHQDHSPHSAIDMFDDYTSISCQLVLRRLLSITHRIDFMPILPL